jgi:hypothetical protein
MIWHRLLHSVKYVPLVGPIHCHLWICACGKRWRP